MYSRDHLGCFGTRERGTCTNKLTISRQEVEERVLAALQEKLLRKDFFEEFCREFAKEMNRLRMEQRAKLSGAKRELDRVKRDIEKGVDAIIEGYRTPELKARMEALQERKEALLAQLATADEPPPLLHPSMADLYRSKVEELAAALRREDSRLEAAETLRGLIDSIVLTPQDGQLRVELKGNLAAMLTAAQKTKRSAGNWRPFRADSNGCGGGDLNPRPLGYEPNELPDCSTPRHVCGSDASSSPQPNEYAIADAVRQGNVAIRRNRQRRTTCQRETERSPATSQNAACRRRERGGASGRGGAGAA